MNLIEILFGKTDPNKVYNFKDAEWPGKLRRKSWPKQSWLENGDEGEMFYFCLDPVVGEFKSRPYDVVIESEYNEDDWELYYYDQPIRDNSIKEGRVMKYVMLFAIIFSLFMLCYSVSMLSIRVEDLNDKIDKIVIFLNLDLNAENEVVK
jgi:hypothetical protein